MKQPITVELFSIIARRRFNPLFRYTKKFYTSKNVSFHNIEGYPHLVRKIAGASRKSCAIHKNFAPYSGRKQIFKHL